MITKDNKLVLANIIELVTKLIEWVGQNLQSAKQADYFKQLVTYRRHLKRRYEAISNNPTIAAYGESQVGKSYIISSLLSSPGKPLMIENDEGKLINFIENINEKTSDQESTGVVTRFTTENFVINKLYPVKIKLLSVADIVTILADCYMNDIIGYKPYNESDLAGIAAELSKKYADRPKAQTYLTEDEIGDIEEYLNKYDGKFAGNYTESGFFERVSLFITRVPVDEWYEVFSRLWNRDPVLTNLFKIIIDGYKRLEFADEVYISTKAVLNDKNDGSSTLMSVSVLAGINELYQNQGVDGISIPIFLPESNKMIRLDKSLLSALTAEAVFHVDEEIVNYQLKFNFSGIRNSLNRSAEDIKSQLIKDGFDKAITKSFLAKNEKIATPFDLLDFPGARGRASGFTVNQIQVELVKLLLRGKVTYLFNKYSEEKKLSILLFCHHFKNPTPNLVAPLLNSWVENYIGENPQVRAKVLKEYEISPLFLISTMYNKDLIVEKNAHTGEQIIDKQIWQRRLGTVLEDQVIDCKANSWFDKWISNNSDGAIRFDNTYLLRDYMFSSGLNGCHNLFKGYPGEEIEEVDAEYRIKLKEVFLRDSKIQHFFSDAELSWNVASTIGNDGTYYLIKQLSRVTINAEKARNVKFTNEVERILENVYDLMKQEYHDGNDTEMLMANIRKAKNFKFVMRQVCEKHNDFFGRMIQFLQLDTHYTASILSEVIHSPQIPDDTGVKKYEMIVSGVEEEGYHFDLTKGEDYNYSILKEVYGLERDDKYLADIDPKLLFGATYKKRCNPSIILSSILLEKWFAELNSAERSLYFSQVGFNSGIFSDFMRNLGNMAVKIDLQTIIADSIREYVDFTAVIDERNEELISDVATSIFNTFIMDMGYSLIKAEEVDNIRKINEKHSLRLSLAYDKNENEMDMDVNVKLFESLESLGDGMGGQLLKLPSYQNMVKWVEQVFVSFIVSYNMPDYDEKANITLGKILTGYQINRQLV